MSLLRLPPSGLQQRPYKRRRNSMRFALTASMPFPPVRDGVSHSGADHVAVCAMAIEAFITAIKVVDATVMIFNGLHQALLQHLVKTVPEFPVQGNKIALG